MNPVLEDRLARLDEITLEKRWHEVQRIRLGAGTHNSFEEGVCAMEAVAYIAGERWSDSPQCVSPTVATFLRRWNDDLDDEDRQMLKPLLPKVIGTANGKRAETKRGWMCADWLIRVHASAWLEAEGLDEQAKALRNLPELKSASGLDKAQPKIDAAWAAAEAAAWAAAKAATWDFSQAAAWAAAASAIEAAAGAAAGAAAKAAAGGAAWTIIEVATGTGAWNAMGAATGTGAWAAAGVAIRKKKLDPTKVGLQKSARKLVERMIAVQ